MKRFSIFVVIFLMLSGCSSNNTITFQEKIVIEYGESLNPVMWLKTGDFDHIELIDADQEKLGNQNVTVVVTNGSTQTEYPLTIRIVDTKGPNISENKPFVVEYGDEIEMSDYFSAHDLRDGYLNIESTLIDTKKLGIQRVLLWAQDNEGNRTQTEVEMTVIDINPPLIIQKHEFLIELDQEINLPLFFRVEDEQASEVVLELKGYYDLATKGSYPVTVVATDPSGNTNSLETVLIVYEYADEADDNYAYIELADIRDDRYTLVNKRYQLPYDYVPEELVYFPAEYKIGDASATLETVEAFVKMATDAKNDGVNLSVEKGYLSYWNQSRYYNNLISTYGVERAEELTNRAGHSEHQLGVALDFCENKSTCGMDFGETLSSRWLEKNAADYGFILRFTKAGEAATGILYQPYHYRYVGTQVAKHYNSLNLTYEEYYHQFSDTLK